jgi:hypothetical protein
LTPPRQIYSAHEDGSEKRDIETPEKHQNLTSWRDPEGELAEEGPSLPLLGSSEAKLSIFIFIIFIIIINIIIIIINNIGHIIVILNIE